VPGLSLAVPGLAARVAQRILERGDLPRLAGLERLQGLPAEPPRTLAHHGEALARGRAGRKGQAGRLHVQQLEGPAPVGLYPPDRVVDHRTSLVPRGAGVERMHADLVLVPAVVPLGLLGRELQARVEEAGHEYSVVGEHPVQLEQPSAPLLDEVREHRRREDQVERTRGVGQGWPLAVHEDVQRRGEILLETLYARPIDVAAPQLRAGGLRNEVSQHPTGAAAEVEYALPLERPSLREGPAEVVPDRSAKALVGLDRAVEAPAAHSLPQVGWGDREGRHARESTPTAARLRPRRTRAGAQVDCRPGAAARGLGNERLPL